MEIGMVCFTSSISFQFKIFMACLLDSIGIKSKEWFPFQSFPSLLEFGMKNCVRVLQQSEETHSWNLSKPILPLKFEESNFVLVLQYATIAMPLIL